MIDNACNLTYNYLSLSTGIFGMTRLRTHTVTMIISLLRVHIEHALENSTSVKIPDA
jgi:hypothetical protein